MTLYDPGWFGLENSKPVNPAEIIAYAELDSVVGTLQNSTTFATPEAGSWTTPSPIAVTNAQVDHTNKTYQENLEMKAAAMSMNTKFINPTSPPPPMRDLMYLYGNPAGVTDWQMTLTVNFTVSCDVVELSVLENLGTSGDMHSRYQVYDFGSGPFSGSKTLKLVFSGHFGPLNLGFHIEKDDDTNSSILVMRSVILPVPAGNGIVSPSVCGG